METKKRQLWIKRTTDEDAGLGFLVSFDPGDGCSESMFFPYDAYQRLLSMGREFLQSSSFTEVVNRWDHNPD